MYRVLKQFNSVNRRFHVGVELAAEDMPANANVDQMIERGFIELIALEADRTPAPESPPADVIVIEDNPL